MYNTYEMRKVGVSMEEVKTKSARMQDNFAIALVSGILSSFWTVQLSSIYLLFQDLGFTGLWQCTRLPHSIIKSSLHQQAMAVYLLLPVIIALPSPGQLPACCIY